jgi:hypothetical protein
VWREGLRSIIGLRASQQEQHEANTSEPNSDGRFRNKKFWNSQQALPQGLAETAMVMHKRKDWFSGGVLG